MDPKRGVICRGPEGPYPDLSAWSIESKDMPSTVDLLQDDVCMRFMASCRSKEVDHVFLKGIIWTGSDVAVPESFDQPTVFSVLTQTPIAVANNVWESHYGNLAERKVLENGLTRFRVVGRGGLWLWLNMDVDEAWRCQAPKVFRARGISLGDDESVYHLVWHTAWLDGNLSSSEIQLQRRLQQPIYLFIHPPPPNLPNGETSSLHFWSFHDDGQNPLPPNICNNLGLPTELKHYNDGYESRSWPTKSYRLMDEYQRLCGFDPTTTAFAQHLGRDRNIFEPINDTDRFDDVHDEQCTEPREPPLVLDRSHQSNVNNGVEYPMATQPISYSENVDHLNRSEGERTLTQTTTDCQRMGTGEEMVECRAHADQNIHTDFTSPSEKQTTTKLRDSAQPTREVISWNASDSKQSNGPTQAQNLGCHDVEYTDDSPTSYTLPGYDSGSQKTYESTPESDLCSIKSVSKGTLVIPTPPPEWDIRNPVSAWNTLSTGELRELFLGSILIIV
ncbi:hypothetical protein PM082_006463 [Marasmius tenuissimus]|nr:hypothetical protein PM082_006463 [Marasmius tenuissimus]